MRGGAFVASCLAAAMLLAAGAQAGSPGGNCVAYAREVSGISLDGNAGAWWSQAEGRYGRGQTPAVGAVLVFKPSGHIAVGHVAVVSQVVKPREILVDQANWVRGRVVKGMSVIDASPNNDWTVVKVVELHSGTHGRPNQTYGFVYPHKPHTQFAMGSEDKASAKLPVQLAVVRADDGQAERAKPPAAKASAAEHAIPKDHQRPQRSDAVRAADPRAETAKLSAARPLKDDPKAQRSATAQTKPPAASKASAEKRVAAATLLAQISRFDNLDTSLDR